MVGGGESVSARNLSPEDLRDLNKDICGTSGSFEIFDDPDPGEDSKSTLTRPHVGTETLKKTKNSPPCLRMRQ